MAFMMLTSSPVAAVALTPPTTCMAGAGDPAPGHYYIGDSISSRTGFGAGDALCYLTYMSQGQNSIVNATGGSTWSDHKAQGSFSKARASTAKRIAIELGANDVSTWQRLPTQAERDAYWNTLVANMKASVAGALTSSKCVVLVGLNHRQDEQVGGNARHYSSLAAYVWNLELIKVADASSQVKFMSFDAFGTGYRGMLNQTPSNRYPDGLHPITTEAKIQYAQVVAWWTKNACG